MPSQMASETPDFNPIARWDTVEGVLEALNVAHADQAVQRDAVRRALTMPGLRELLKPLAAELQQRGLV